ncbi:unnamed protein product, partial [Symbiodinium sp. KB8]
EELHGRPSRSEFEETKKELRLLQALHFNVSLEGQEDAAAAGEEGGEEKQQEEDAAGALSVHQIMLKRVRQLEDALVKAQRQASEKEAE